MQAVYGDTPSPIGGPLAREHSRSVHLFPNPTGSGGVGGYGPSSCCLGRGGGHNDGEGGSGCASEAAGPQAPVEVEFRPVLIREQPGYECMLRVLAAHQHQDMYGRAHTVHACQCFRARGVDPLTVNDVHVHTPSGSH